MTVHAAGDGMEVEPREGPPIELGADLFDGIVDFRFLWRSCVYSNQ